MDPLSIASSVVGLTATCLSTCKKLHDLAGEYEDVPTTIAMICSESTVISMGLSELQSKILHRDDLAQAWASRTDILNVFEVALTGCMIVFSCLEAETRNLKLKNPGVFAKLKDTLSSIQKDIREHTRQIKATAAESKSLQSRIPSIKVESQSIFDGDTSRLSLFETTSNIAPSELDFQFDELVINSSAYRRAFAKAHAENQESHKLVEDQAADTDSATPKGVKFDELMNLSKGAPPGISRISLFNAIEAPAEEGGLSPGSQTDSPEEATKKENHQAVDMNSSKSQDLTVSQAVSQLVCNRCSSDITGRSVTALGCAWHPNCFQCYDCGEPLAGRFFPSNEQGKENKPLCEKDYTRMLESKCFKCNEALRGTYITTSQDLTLEQSYHPQHLTCDECDTVLSLESYYTHEKRVYCELHYCRNFAPYCSGCKFPLLGGRDSYLLEGDGRDWHLECSTMTQRWGVQIPVSHKGREYLTTIQSGSMQDLMPDTQKQHVICLRRICNLSSHILSTFVDNLRIALVFRSGYQSFRYWTIMLSTASRLFQAISQLSNEEHSVRFYMMFSQILL
ncbi:hypothetical protein H9Q72_003524 [Fusarium xylarioides]|uniref:LIM zinc-binding domain-containing protein n=1 Tax=Fusarium xylarioides TaxID=221167 RepID=A0A9P7I6L5_9HYPO|nr:hypothetical protein H9Q72_003524 [Fusarium xylarioides]